MSRVSKSSKEEQGEEEVEEEEVDGESWNIGGIEESMGSHIETG